MGMFDRFRKKDEDPAKAEELPKDEEQLEGGQAQVAEDEDEQEPPEKSAPKDRAKNGPYDESEVEEDQQFIDLGSLRIPPREGLGLRFEQEETTGRLVAVALDVDGSTLQLQAFAAPRSSGLWHTIRNQLGEQLELAGGEVDIVDGPFGQELRAELPIVAGGDRRAVRFIGVDGPRWFLRAVLTGPALHDEELAEVMDGVFRDVVVVRGRGPMPPGELLPIALPQPLAEQVEQARAANQTPGSSSS